MRVHEIAKEFELNSKELIPRLKDMGIQVKTHMSSLSDEQVAQVRAALGAPQSEQQHDEVAEVPKEEVVEKRVSTRVIRRRKKAHAEPPPPEPVAKEAEEPAEAAPAPEPEPQPAKEQAVPPEEAKPAEAAPETVTAAEAKTEAEAKAAGKQQESPEPVQANQIEKEAPSAERQIKKVNIRGKESTPARIIDRIDLEARREKPAAADGQPPAAPGVAPADENGRAREGKGPGKDKDRKKRSKFKWNQTVDTDQEGEGVPHRRIRYRIKDKGGRGKAKPSDVIPLVRSKRGGAIERPKSTEKTTPKAIKRKIRLQEGIIVADLAKRMGIKASEIIKKLIALGEMATINQTLEIDTASLVAADFGYEIESVTIEEEAIFEEQLEDADHDLQSRCPVVTVMGHVDHGKTTLLDAIRKTKVAEGEKGGITQHIGAYRVSLSGGDIAFVDTPGHEAFTTMRARGAQVTDIVILVVAAEEGSKPQTIEAINHAKAAQVPIIVALNKCDKPEANPEKVRQELSSQGLVPEEWGGDTIFAEISAKKKQGIDKLLDMVLLQAEMLELKANPNKPAKGTIVEARLDKGRGPIATVLVQEGTLKAGDAFVSRHNYGKVRALINDRGVSVKQAGPSTPVEVLGFTSVPEAGDVFIAVDEKKARQTSAYWQKKKRHEDLRKDSRLSLENFLSSVKEQEIKELWLIIKADVQGSVEALQQSLENLSTDEVKVNVIHSSVGSISLNDIMLASASNAIIIGFGVKTEPKVPDTAEKEKVDVRLYNIIYDVIDDVKKAMLGMLAPKLVENLAGKAEVKQVFDISKLGTIAGCFVLEGKVVNGSRARVVRNDSVIHEGNIASLKRYKDDAKEALSGQDCGIHLENFKAFEAGDIIESFFLEEVERTL